MSEINRVQEQKVMAATQNLQRKSSSKTQYCPLDAVTAYNVAQCHDTASAAYAFMPDRQPTKCSERFKPGPNQPKPFQPDAFLQYPLQRVSRIPGTGILREGTQKISDLYKL